MLRGGVACLLGGSFPPPPGSPEPHPTREAPFLPTAHSHNDYKRERPFHQAAELGFGSIEVDVIPSEGRLLVGHDRTELRPDRDLTSMYLVPISRFLTDRAATAAGSARTTLLIDIKRDPDTALDLLLPLLRPLRPLLQRVEDEHVVPGPLEIVISGSRPRQRIAAMSTREIFIDGRLEDLDADPPVHLVPMISASMKSALDTYGLRGLDPEALERLRILATRTHGQGRRLRFWGHLGWPGLWQALVDARVDHIGTDRPEVLAAWLQRNDPRCRRAPVP